MASIYALLVFVLCTTTLSLPIERQQVVQNVHCHSINTYTTDWFLRNTLPAHRREIHGKALFYTKGASKYAQRLACGSGARGKEYVSIWQIWPQWLYDDSNRPENPLRCIHNDHGRTKTFYENMSEAYARMARRRATVMHMSDDYTDPPLNGIWGRVELPALRGMTDIVEMDKINEDSSRRSEWLLPDKGAKSVADKAIDEVQRIFRSAKSAWSYSGPTTGTKDAACTLWSSKEAGYLDSLW